MPVAQVTEYRISSKICKDCPFKRECLGKTAQEKKFSVTYYREEYQRNNARVNSKQGRYGVSTFDVTDFISP